MPLFTVCNISLWCPQNVSEVSAQNTPQIFYYIILLKCLLHLQGSSNLFLEVQSAVEFSSNPDQTRLPVIFLMILKTLISMLRCV